MAVLKFLRELREVARLQHSPSLSSGLVAYAEDIVTWSVLGPYLERVAAEGRHDLLYVTSAEDDPILSASSGMRVSQLSQTVPWWLARLRAGVFFTTTPDLGTLISRPPAATPCVYAFHSLVSTHRAYRPGAFDHYDAFFCAGPHHRAEIEAHFSRQGRPTPELLDIGYARLDRLAERFRSKPATAAASPLALVAPTWGAGNLLETAGVSVVSGLRDAGFRVIVRPHPCFWLPIYPAGRGYVQQVIDHFRDDADVAVQRDINSDAAYLDADLLVSDFSGAAYEYAFATRRPVLFIDVPGKTLNPNWRELGLPTFEDRMRREVGTVIAPDRVAEVGRTAAQLLHDAPSWADRLAALHEQHVYHPGRSAEIGAAALDELVSRKRRSGSQ
jgi:YidC/Oxa1 family membrane protein insertase